jgi:hypothetical protein
VDPTDPACVAEIAGAAANEAVTNPNGVVAKVGGAAITLSDALSDPMSLLARGVELLSFRVAQTIGYLAGALVAIEAYLVELILQINFNIIHSPIVEMGFPIVLSLANLLFVAGIIVVAVATIIRYEGYGVKNVLWKLLVMAVLINFGLIIAGTILNFSDSITMYMVKSIAPSEENGGLQAFSDTLAGAFNPQRNVITGDLNKNISQGNIQNYQSAWNQTGQDVGALLSPLFGVILSIFGYLIILVVLGALIVVLFVRYLQLLFLLISLPLAWAAWPFPAFHGKTAEWWTKFWKQAFYPIPIVFCLWLGLMFAQKMSEVSLKGIIAPGTEIPGTTGATQGLAGAISNLLIGASSSLADNLFRIIILGGIMMAGLIAANGMGAAFAGTAMNAIKSGQNRAKNAVTSRIKNRAERVRIRAKEAYEKPRAKLLKLKMERQRNVEEAAAAALKGDMTKYNALNALDKANAQIMMQQQKIGDIIQKKTAPILEAAGYEGHFRLGFNGVPRKRLKVKTGSDGKAVLGLDIAREETRMVDFVKLVDKNNNNRVIGEAEIDPATGQPRVDAASGRILLTDGTLVDSATVNPGIKTSRNMRHVIFRDEKGEDIATKDASGNITGGWVKQDASGNWLAPKDQNGDLIVNAEVIDPATGKKVVQAIGTAKKTGVQILDDKGGIVKTASSKDFVDKDGNLSAKFADEEGNPMHGSTSKQGSYETQDKINRVKEQLHHDDKRREELIEEARKQPGIAGEVAGVIGETVGALGKGGGGGGGGGAPKPPAKAGGTH